MTKRTELPKQAIQMADDAAHAVFNDFKRLAAENGTEIAAIHSAAMLAHHCADIVTFYEASESRHEIIAAAYKELLTEINYYKINRKGKGS